MKSIILMTLIMSINASVASPYLYEVSQENPFGLPNPESPKQIQDFHKIMGTHTCDSVSRNPDQTWADAVDMSWTFKYIMNGMGVQDTTLKADGKHSGSIRQYDVENKTWQISYYSSSVNSKAEFLPMWKGGLKGDDLVFYKDQKAPNGMEGFFRLTFYEMNKDGFKWIGEWTDKEEKIIYPTWKIDCKKTQ